jgi:endonuclease YncB( thermonuclease family)
MRKILLFILTVALLTTYLAGFEIVEVTRVVDGDTFLASINGEEQYIRFLGVDTPESVKRGTPIEEGAIEASNFTKQLSGKQVILTYDKDHKTDFFGRILGYVWVEIENGQIICWNIKLIKDGHSDLYTKYKFNGLEWFKEVLKNEND